MQNGKVICANVRFAFRSDTAENWANLNPVLLAGEHGVVTDGTETEKEKIGDGVTPWNKLGWWKGSKGDKGDKGEMGYTPIKGVDYFTEEEKQEIIASVLDALPNGDEVNY